MIEALLSFAVGGTILLASAMLARSLLDTCMDWYWKGK